MTGSYLIYIGLMIFCFVMALVADKRNSKPFVWLIIIFLTLIAGLRNEMVGIDTYGYVSKFTLISEGSFQYAYGLEESFKYLCSVLLKLYNNNTFLLVLFAFITSTCIILRFWDLRKISSFSCMVICYYMSFYFITMNCMRQFCAVAIIFYFTRYLEKRKFIWFAIGVLLAYIFHQTAIVGFVLLALSYVQWKNLEQRQKVVLIAGVMALPLIIYYMAQILIRYQKYLMSISPDVGIMLIIKLLFLLMSLFYVFVLQKKEFYFNEEVFADKNSGFIRLEICVCYFLGLCLASLGYMFHYADRISWYFYMFEGAYMGMLIKGKEPLNKLIFGCVIAFLIGYGFIYSMINNSQGNMPYLFFWQQ